MSGKADLSRAAATFERELEWMEDLGQGAAESLKEWVPAHSVLVADVRDHFAHLSKAFETLKKSQGKDSSASLLSISVEEMEPAMETLQARIKALPKSGILNAARQAEIFGSPVDQLTQAAEHIRKGPED